MKRTSSKTQTHYELNYLIREEVALSIRDFVQTFLDFEEFSVGRPNFSFAVHTLYLDSDGLTLYRQAINDIEHRCQLRLRYYNAHPEAPVFLEIKQRLADVVVREQYCLQRENLSWVLAGQMPPRECSCLPNSNAPKVLEHFVTRVQSIQAKPILHVAFLREAYQSDDTNVRISLDRDILCEPQRMACLTCTFGQPYAVYVPYILLELTFVDRFPDWLREMVERFNLTECEADKYLTGISTLLDKTAKACNEPRRI